MGTDSDVPDETASERSRRNQVDAKILSMTTTTHSYTGDVPRIKGGM
jgi:hypothetical protein